MIKVANIKLQETTNESFKRLKSPDYSIKLYAGSRLDQMLLYQKICWNFSRTATNLDEPIEEISFKITEIRLNEPMRT